VDTVPEPGNGLAEMAVELCRNEYDSQVVNLTNFTGRPLEVRASLESAGEPWPVEKHVQLRRAATVPTERRDLVADALPPLDGSGLIGLPPFDSQQLWLTIRADGLEPGIHEAKLRLTSMEVIPTVVELPLRITVQDLELPHAVRFCTWTSESGPLGTGRDVVLEDVVAHGVNVLFGKAPKAVCDETGALVGDVDFANTTPPCAATGPRLPPVPEPTGQPERAAAPRGAVEEGICGVPARLGGAHGRPRPRLQGLGPLPYDEPSTPYAETTLDLVEVARLVREADPRIRVYTDPTSGTTMKSVELYRDLIDIWCPSSELLERFGDELLPVARQYGDEVWFYDAAGGAKTLSCLGMYRWRFWHAWNLA